MTPATVFPAWVGAFAIAVAINYFAPVMDWVASWTKRIKKAKDTKVVSSKL